MADETRYEVGQIVATVEPTHIHLRVGDQLRYAGLSSASNGPWFLRDHLLYCLDWDQVRPLAPGETPTIDSRGYPIGSVEGRKGFQVGKAYGSRIEPPEPEDDAGKKGFQPGNIYGAMMGHPDLAELSTRISPLMGVSLLAEKSESLVEIANGLECGALISRTVEMDGATVTTTIDMRPE